jgi:hypothetical protein
MYLLVTTTSDMKGKNSLLPLAPTKRKGAIFGGKEHNL